MIIMQIGRSIVGIIEIVRIRDYRQNPNVTDINKLLRLEYFNISSECIFNVFILYYFISISK
jgi:hypothetical protein